MILIMPWSKEHKRDTKQRIVEAAATALREGGVAPTGVAEIMQRAGLTHGGFYAHFKSKDALVREAFTHAANTVKQVGGIEAYLSRGHMLHPELGCPFPTLGPEMARGSTTARRTFADAIRARLDGIRKRLSGKPDMEAKAAGTLACMVGAILLARGLPESEGDAFLGHVRAFLRESVGDEIL